MNKHILLIASIIIVVIAAYFFLLKDDATPPVVDEVVPVVEKETDSEVEPVTETASSDYVGMTVLDAQAKAEAEGVLFRVVEEDGQPQPTTKDYRPGRINASVESGVVTEYTVEGSETQETELVGHDIIIGMTTAEAQAYAEENEVGFRTGSIDGEPMAVTMDYRPGRITADIVGGVVVDYTVEE